MWRTSKDRIDRIVVFSAADGDHRPMGALTFEGAGVKRVSVFRYARSWLAARGAGIDPEHLPPRASATRSPAGSEVPLPFIDAAPDGWGRLILERTFPEQFFGEAEFLSAAGEDRVGDLAFGPDETRPERWIPPHNSRFDIPDDEVSLADVEAAAAAVDGGRASRNHLELLFRASADVGGARPKAGITRSGEHWIAKFRAVDDALDEPRVEACCMTMAAACGIEVPEHMVVQVGDRPVLLVRRFDRVEERRLGYTSAATLLSEPSIYSTKHTYADLAAKARQAGIRPCEEDLFRRMLFNCFVRNTDDHLRNHGFVREDAAWRLSPAFDLTMHKPRRLVMPPATGISPEANPATSFAAYPAFGLSREKAVGIYDQVAMGMSALREAWERHDVGARDREVLSAAWVFALDPPPVTALPQTSLVRVSRNPGQDPQGRLRELGVSFDTATHAVRKVGRSIDIRRIKDGLLDNAPGHPARIRAAWSDRPEPEHFDGGLRCPPANEDPEAPGDR